MKLILSYPGTLSTLKVGATPNLNIFLRNKFDWNKPNCNQVALFRRGVRNLIHKFLFYLIFRLIFGFSNQTKFRTSLPEPKCTGNSRLLFSGFGSNFRENTPNFEDFTGTHCPSSIFATFRVIFYKCHVWNYKYLRN